MPSYMSIFRINAESSSETLGNNGSQLSAFKDLDTNNSVGSEVKLDKKLDEESGERERGEDILHAETADGDKCAEELKDPNEIPEETSEVAKEVVDIDICRSELEPTPLPSFGGLANVDVCAEEINLPSESSESKGELGSPKPLFLNDDQSESQDKIHSHTEQDASKQANEMSDHDDDDDEHDDNDAEDPEEGVSEMAGTLLEDTDPEEKSAEQIYAEESAESTIEKYITESVAEGQESEDAINEDQEETNYEYTSTNDVVKDAGDSTSDINSRSLMEMKNTYVDYSDEIHNSKSEVIDVLDEVHHQCDTRTGEDEADNSSDEENTSKIIDALNEEDFLETPKPVSQINGSEAEASNKILNSDAFEKDLNTENVNEGSDLDSDGFEAEEMDLDISNMLQPNMEKTEEEEDDGNHDAEPEEDVYSEAEQADPEPLENETVVVSDELPELQEQTENTENDVDQEDQLEEQRDKSHEMTLESENLENTDSSEEKVRDFLV